MLLQSNLNIHLNLQIEAQTKKLRAKGDYFKVWKLVLKLGFQHFPHFPWLILQPAFPLLIGFQFSAIHMKIHTHKYIAQTK